MRLSKRLQAILDLVPPSSVIVDVGTDHGLLIIKAVEEGISLRAYGLDIASGPLNQARRNVQEYELSDRIQLMQLDGLKGFTDPADVFVIAGMGAETIWEIISNASFPTNSTLILQSNSKEAWLRKTLTDNGFMIVDEQFLYDRGKPVFIEVVKLGHQTLTDKDILLGPFLTLLNHDYLSYLNKRRKHLQTVVKHNPLLIEELEVIERYLREEV